MTAEENKPEDILLPYLEEAEKLKNGNPKMTDSVGDIAFILYLLDVYKGRKRCDP